MVTIEGPQLDGIKYICNRTSTCKPNKEQKTVLFVTKIPGKICIEEHVHDFVKTPNIRIFILKF